MMAYNDSAQERTADERRAEWEKFTMVVLEAGEGGGYVNVRNDSYDNPNEHIHSVHVEDGRADGCSCPHAVYRDAHCKHQIAVENRPLVVSSANAASASTGATTSRAVATDGGTVVESGEDSDTDENHDAQPRTDYWGNAVEHFNDGPVGAGERRECQSCGATTMQISMVAATADSSNRNWEEFYRCENCDATGSFRFESREHHEARRTWTGVMNYPEEVR